MVDIGQPAPTFTCDLALPDDSELQSRYPQLYESVCAFKRLLFDLARGN